MLRAEWLVVVVLGAVLLGCGGDDDRPANWRYIHAAIIAPSCATSSCHSSSNAQAGVVLHDMESAYAILTGHPCGGNSPPGEAPRNYVVPGQPEASRLMYLLLNLEVSRPMPPDRPLPGPDIALIERWILEGARCD